MPRVKRGVQKNKRRKNLLQNAKGFKWGRKSKYRQAKEGLYHAWAFMFADRKKKKRNFRRLWQIQINAAARENGTTYSRLTDSLKKSNIEIDRKVLATIAQTNPEIFKQIVETATK